MPSTYKKIKNLAGVYYYDSTTNKYRDRPDRTFVINYRDETRKVKWLACGKASDGCTAAKAQHMRREILEQIRFGTYKSKKQQKKDSITLNQFMINHYLPWTQQNQKRPSDDKSRYSNWIKKPLGNLPLDQITQKDVEIIVQKMQDAGRANGTINHIIKLIRHVFNKAAELQKWQGTNPCHFIKLRKLNNKREKFLSKEQTDLLLTKLHTISPQTSNIAALSLFSGMRLGEIFNLKWKDINIEFGIITILDTKNAETRSAFITEPIEQLLKKLTAGKPEEYVFQSTKGTQIKCLSKTFSRIIKKLRFNEGITDRRQKVTFHTLRHTYASWAAMAGVPIYQLSKALGHKTMAMTERYAHLAPDSYRNVSEKVASFK